MRDGFSSLQIEKIWARSEVVFAKKLAELDPSWGTSTFELADGFGVLCGKGLFVNHVMAAGMDATLQPSHLADLERRSEAAGVQAAIEVTEVSHPDVEPMLVERGYRQISSRTAVARSTESAPAAESVVVEPVDTEGVSLWQDTAAEALGIGDPQVRRASDIFALTASVVDEPGLIIAKSASDGRPLGVATLKVNEGIATFGGMSTLPAERKKGVQGALIAHRLRQARSLGCSVAVSMADTGSVSERNLIRHGFEVTHHKVLFALSPS